MGREEQVEEREVLDSIFPDEITDVSEIEYRIKITLDIPDDEAEEPPVMYLTVRYPEDYPDKPPHLDLSPAPNAAAHPLLSVADDRAELLGRVEATVEENLGMAMVFTVVTTLKEEAELLAVSRREAAERAHEEHVLAAEREENKKFHGTPVNRETFLQWREGFLREMEEQRLREEEERLAELKKAKVKEGPRLTGRQLWERGLVGKVDEDEDAAEGSGDDDDDDVPTEGVEKLKVGATA